jgi:hypothetical protein
LGAPTQPVEHRPIAKFLIIGYAFLVVVFPVPEEWQQIEDELVIVEDDEIGGVAVVKEDQRQVHGGRDSELLAELLDDVAAGGISGEIVDLEEGGLGQAVELDFEGDGGPEKGGVVEEVVDAAQLAVCPQEFVLQVEG